MMARWSVAIAMLALLGTAGAESSGRTIKEALVEKLDLFSLCPTEERMDLLVDELPVYATRAGLTRERIRSTIAIRLRGARIYDRNADPLLHAVIVLGEPDEGGHIPFYSIELSYLRDLLAERLGSSALAETWSTAGSGQGDAGSFLGHLNGFLDEFILEYQRVRDSEACLSFRRRHSSQSRGQSGGRVGQHK